MSKVQEFLGLTPAPTLETILAFMDQCSQPIVLTTYDYKCPAIVHANAAHADLTGYPLVDIVGKNPKMFQGGNTNTAVVADMHDGLLRFDCWDGIILNYTATGTEYRVYIVIVGILTGSGERCYLAAKSKL